MKRISLSCAPISVECLFSTPLLSGLVPDYVTPDFLLALTYEYKGAFSAHYDSRYTWGEAVVGVSLGQKSVIYFTVGNYPFPALHNCQFFE
jgi:hypothetical protein